MDRSLRIDIAKREAQIIFIHNVSRNLPVDDFQKYGQRKNLRSQHVMAGYGANQSDWATGVGERSSILRGFLRFVQPWPPFNLTSAAVKYTVTDIGYKDAEKSAGMATSIMCDSL